MKEGVLIALFLGLSFARAKKETCPYSVSGKVLDADAEEMMPHAVIRVEGAEK